MMYQFFLTGEYKRGLWYKALQNVFSALSNRIPYSVKYYHTIEKLMKGIFTLCPPKNKYHSIWNIDKLLQYLQSIETERDTDISRKLVTLMILLSGTRVNTLTCVIVIKMFIIENESSFTSDEVLKHFCPNYCQKSLAFWAYPECSSLCPVTTLPKFPASSITKIIKSWAIYHNIANM